MGTKSISEASSNHQADAASEEVFAIIKQALEVGRVDELLNGPVARRGFYLLTRLG